MGGKSTQSTQSVSIPPQVLAAYQSVNQKAAQTAQTPFQQYQGQFVAPVNAEQQSGIAATNATSQEAQPYYQAAAGLTAASAAPVNAQPLTPSNINQYLSPYLSDVVGSESALLNQNNQQQQAGQLGTAISSGAFGGDRTGLAAANLEQQQNLANANIYSGLLNTGYNTALSTAQQQQGVNLSAAQANRAALQSAGSQLAGIGSSAQTSGLQGASAQIGAGTLQQQTQQAQDTALYNQFLQQQSYPFQVDQFLANIAEGTGALSGSTTTTTQPGGFFSDERLKTDIKKIGKTFDGQTLYSYRLHGDPRTRVGLIAQEVEKKHPEAVGLAAGYKTVDYGEATAKAANKGHFASGGVAGYANGGDPSDLSAILAAQQQMYSGQAGGLGAYGLQAGTTPHGGSSRVPPAPSGGSPHLMTAQGQIHQQPTGLQNLQQLTNLARSGQELYNDVQRPKSATIAPSTTSGSGLGNAASALADPDVFFDPNAAASSVPPNPGLASARGGRIHKDDGGGINPYGGPELDIPDDQNQRQLATAGQLPQQHTGLQNVSTLGSLVSNIADLFASGGIVGRRGYGAGGDPTDPDGDIPTRRIVDPTEPAVIPVVTQTPAATVNAPPVASAPSTDATSTSSGLATAAPSTDSPGVGGGISGWWDRNKGNVLPILSGIAAMGEAPTRHLGVALAAGLGAAANDYVPTQEGLARAQGLQLQNQGAQLGLDVARNALKSQATTPAAAQSTEPEPTDPSQYPAYYQRKYQPTMTPAEAKGVEAAQVASGYLKNPGLKEAAQTNVANRIANSQRAAQIEHDKYYDLATTSADPVVRADATAKVNALHPMTGDTYENGMNRRTGKVQLGPLSQILTPEQQQQSWTAAISEGNEPTVIGGANPVPRYQTVIDARGNQLYNTVEDYARSKTGLSPPGSFGASQTPGAPLSTTQPAPGSRTSSATPQAQTLPGIDINAIPKMPPLPVVKDQATKEEAIERARNNVVLQDHYVEPLAAQRDQAIRNTTLYAQLAKHLDTADPRAFGPSSGTYKALANLKAYLRGVPPDGLVNLDEIDKYLVQLGVGGSKQLIGTDQPLHQQELLSLMAHGNPNIDQPLQVIKNLVAFGKAANDYDMRAANTAISAIRQGNADPVQAMGAIQNQVHREDYISQQLSESNRGAKDKGPPQWHIVQPQAKVPTITSKDQYDALPVGASYIWNGNPGRKK